MATVQGSNVTRRRTKTEKGTRRAWSQKEEDALLACYKEVLTEGWRTENGMRAGYMKKIEIALRKVFPGTDLKADPHISSRIQVWKKDYASLVTILATSGVGFNVNGDHKVECTEEQWEYFCRTDANAGHIRKHAWPLYEGWKEIFGKDRATGDVAEDVVEAVDVLFSNTIDLSQGKNPQPSKAKGKQPADNDYADEPSVCQRSRQQAGKSPRKKKKKSDGNANMCALLEQIHQDTNASLQTIASRFAASADISAARKTVFKVIRVIPGIASKEHFKICDKLLLAPARLEFFMELDDESRQDYVLHMINE